LRVTAPPSTGDSISTLATDRDAASIRHRMNRMYGSQRHIYDLTRKFYLLGRDELLDGLPCAAGATICEMGSGTGRNLIRLARRSSGVQLYGIDISSAMLATASAALRRAGLGDRVRLAESNIEDFDPLRHFGIERFDAVYFSYVLTMLPDWRSAFHRAVDVLRPGGTLAVVDFGAQAGASALRRRVLLGWLALFDVHPRAEMERELLTLAGSLDRSFRHRVIARGYAYTLLLRKPT
jgi:S-adenosylmethionine-diacylgycerolhomoserine-N-methlytransferase